MERMLPIQLAVILPLTFPWKLQLEFTLRIILMQLSSVEPRVVAVIWKPKRAETFMRFTQRVSFPCFITSSGAELILSDRASHLKALLLKIDSVSCNRLSIAFHELMPRV